MISWTDERIDILKRLWKEGLSASQIANEISGDITRNAVIGKIHRLGLSGGRKITTSPKGPFSQAKTAQEKRGTGLGAPSSHPLEPLMFVKQEVQPPVLSKSSQKEIKGPVTSSLADTPLIPNATVMQINEQTCKWPVGDPHGEDFHFCARRREYGESHPYCAHHARIAYQSVADRRRTRRRIAAK